MNGMNFEEWQALMRTQRNGGTSSEIHNHEAVIGNKNPNSKSGNAAADELRAKQRYHNEQSKGMATDRKELVTPSGGEVGFSNVLAQNYSVLTVNDKIITHRGSGSSIFAITFNNDDVDQIIANNTPISNLIFGNVNSMTIDALANEDSTPINVDTQIVDRDVVPTNIDDYYINVELRFIEV